MKDTTANISSTLLPTLTRDQFTYNPEKNVFLTLGYTSAAGNTYYSALRVSDRIAVFYHLGQGYCYTFLNGITLFCWDGTHAKIIARRFWGGSDWRCFSEQFARSQSISMLAEYLVCQAKAIGACVSEQKLREEAERLIGDAAQGKLTH